MNAETSMQVWELAILVISTVLASSAISIGLIGVIALKILNTPAAIKIVESLAANVDPKAAVTLVEIGRSASAVGALISEAFDGVPAGEKPG